MKKKKDISKTINNMLNFISYLLMVFGNFFLFFILSGATYLNLINGDGFSLFPVLLLFQMINCIVFSYLYVKAGTKL